jgi:hypothetical protein
MEDDPKELADRAVAWLVTTEGQRTMREAIVEADELVKRLNEDRKVTPEPLHQPMTI